MKDKESVPEGWKVNETINGLISPHNDLNIEKFHQGKTEIKPEENVAEKEPESGDEMEKEVNRTKIDHRRLERVIQTKVVSQKSQLSVQSEIFNQKLNNDTGNCIQEIKSSDLKLKLSSNLGGAKGNKKSSSYGCPDSGMEVLGETMMPSVGVGAKR